MRKTRVSGTAKDVALSLIDKFGGGEDGRIYPSHAALAADTGLDERTVRAAVSKLHEAGLIATKSRGSTSTMYFFADPTDTNVTVESGQRQHDERHKRDGLADINVTNREPQTCQSDRHKRDANHDQLTCPLNMDSEHDRLASCESAPAGRPSDSFDPDGSQGTGTYRHEDVDLLLADAIRDGDDTDLLPLSHSEMRDAMQRRYGKAIEEKWWLVSAWWTGQIDWIDAIAELEKEKSDEEMRGHG